MLYAAYYFFFKTKMYGVFQTCFYFGQMLVTCVAIGLVCGTMGYLGARSPFFSLFFFSWLLPVLVVCVRSPIFLFSLFSFFLVFFCLCFSLCVSCVWLLVSVLEFMV